MMGEYLILLLTFYRKSYKTLERFAYKCLANDIDKDMLENYLEEENKEKWNKKIFSLDRQGYDIVEIEHLDSIIDATKINNGSNNENDV